MQSGVRGPGHLPMVDVLAQLEHFQEDARRALTFSPCEPTFFLQEMQAAIHAYHQEEIQPLLHDPSRCWIVRVGLGPDGRAVLRLYYCRKPHVLADWWPQILSPREAQVSCFLEHSVDPATSVLGDALSAEDVLRTYYDREHGMKLEALEGRYDCSTHYTLSFDLATVQRRAEAYARVELAAPQKRHVGDMRVAFATLARATRLDAGVLSTVQSFLPSYFEHLRH